MKHCILLVTQLYYYMLICICQSIAEYYICFHILSSSVWQACWPPVIIKLCKTFPFNKAGRRLAPHPLLAIIPSPTAIYLYFIQSALFRICMYCVIQEYVAIHEMWKERKSTCSICVGGPGRLPASSPHSVGGAVGGGGRVGEPCSAWGFWAGKGGISGKQAASWNGRFFWQVNLAGYSRGWIRQIFTARYFGGSFWHIYLAGFHKQWKVKLLSKEEKGKKMYNQWICRLRNVIIY